MTTIPSVCVTSTEASQLSVAVAVHNAARIALADGLQSRSVGHPGVTVITGASVSTFHVTVCDFSTALLLHESTALKVRVCDL